MPPGPYIGFDIGQVKIATQILPMVVFESHFKTMMKQLPIEQHKPYIQEFWTLDPMLNL